MTPEEMVARLLYRDGLMLVVDKPPGMAVHRGPKGGESLEDHFDAAPSDVRGPERKSVRQSDAGAMWYI